MICNQSSLVAKRADYLHHYGDVGQKDEPTSQMLSYNSLEIAAAEFQLWIFSDYEPGHLFFTNF